MMELERRKWAKRKSLKKARKQIGENNGY